MLTAYRIVTRLETFIESQANAKESVEQISADLKGRIDQMSQKLESREDALTQQLAEKRSENALVTRIMEEREEEFQTLEIQLEEAKETNRAQDERIRQLAARIEEMEGLPRFESRGELRLKTLAEENDQIRSELEAKAAAITNLERELQEQDKMYLNETRKFGDDISKLTQLLHEQQLATRAGTDQAVENARRQLRLEMERREEETRTSLRLAEENRLDLETRLQVAERALSVRGQSPSHGSAVVASLQETLAAAESRICELTMEAQEKKRGLEASQKRDVVEIRKEATELAVNEMSQALVNSLTQWKQGNGVGDDVVIGIEKFLNDCIPTQDIGHRLQGLLGNYAPPGGLHQPTTPRPQSDTNDQNLSLDVLSESPLIENDLTSQPPGAQNTIDGPVGSEDANATPEGREKSMSSSSPLSDLPVSPTEAEPSITGETVRRVLVKSPNINQVTPMPPTVEEERVRRRGIVQLRPIIKPRPEPSANTVRDSGQDRGLTGGVIPDYGLFLRSPYNRPVAGTVPRDDRRRSQFEAPKPTSTAFGQNDDGNAFKGDRVPKRGYTGDGLGTTAKKPKRGPRDLDAAAEPLTTSLPKEPNSASRVAYDDRLRPLDATGQGTSAAGPLPSQVPQHGLARTRPIRSTRARSVPGQQNSTIPQSLSAGTSQRGKAAGRPRGRGGKKTGSIQPFQPTVSSPESGPGPSISTNASPAACSSSAPAPLPPPTGTNGADQEN